MKQGRVLMEVMKSWINNVINEGSAFIQEFISTYLDGEGLLGEVRTLVPSWEMEEEKCATVVIQVQEIEMYDVT